MDFCAGREARMKKYAVVQRIDTRKYERVIAVSDLHGDYAGFDAMLSSVAFSKKDALVIVGDILEKGTEFLSLLRRITTLIADGNVFMVLGNNDAILIDWISNEISDTDMLGYVLSREQSTVKEMACELNMPYHTEDMLCRLKAQIQLRYASEIAMLSSAPHILESDAATFVHAGITSEDIDKQEIDFCLAAKAFSQQGYRFDKPVIVGHWPASNYSKTVIDVNVHINQDANIYSIDGGNSMKSWGQINVLTIEKHGKITCSAIERCPQIQLLDDQHEQDSPVSLVFPNTKIEMMEDLGVQKRCFVPYLGKEMLFDSDRIYSYKGDLYCSDFTTHQPAAAAGEIASYCKVYEDGILIKQNGIVGKYCGRYVYV